MQCEKDTGLAILPDVSVPSDLNASMRRQKSKEEEFLDRAVEEGDNSMIRFMRKAMAKRELSSHGRNTVARNVSCAKLESEHDLLRQRNRIFETPKRSGYWPPEK